MLCLQSSHYKAVNVPIILSLRPNRDPFSGFNCQILSQIHHFFKKEKLWSICLSCKVFSFHWGRQANPEVRSRKWQIEPRTKGGGEDGHFGIFGSVYANVLLSNALKGRIMGPSVYCIESWGHITCAFVTQGERMKRSPCQQGQVADSSLDMDLQPNKCERERVKERVKERLVAEDKIANDLSS